MYDNSSKMIEKYDRGDHYLFIDRSGKRPTARRVRKNAPPSVIKQAANFTRAAVNHIKAGRPRATQEQVDARFAICETCEHLDNETMRCSKCGCGIKSVVGPISKLTWADSRCPDKRWGPI